MKSRLSVVCLLFLLLVITSCKKDSDEEDPKTPEPKIINSIPEFFPEASEGDYGKLLPQIKIIASSTNKIAIPQDLDFHPTRTNEIWIVNKGTEATGGTNVIISNAGETNQSSIFLQDGNAWHFMSLPSALAFSTNGNWANSANVLDANHSGGRFTGPALWSSDMAIFAQPSGGNGSHLDMVHQSPYTMGIAAEKDNVFWVFDGYYENIIRYDFAQDHGPGNDYHEDALLRRYSEVKVKRDPNVPSHLVLDDAKKWLYIIDGGNKRILRLDINTGSVVLTLPPIDENLAEYSKMGGATWEIFTDINLQKPCGIDIVENRLFVTDYATGEIICYDVNTKSELGRLQTGKPGIAGIKVYNHKVWFVNALENTVNVILKN